MWDSRDKHKSLTYFSNHFTLQCRVRLRAEREVQKPLLADGSERFFITRQNKNGARSVHSVAVLLTDGELRTVRGRLG